jgi:hypothetical protein
MTFCKLSDTSDSICDHLQANRIVKPSRQINGQLKRKHTIDKPACQKTFSSGLFLVSLVSCV